MRILIVNPVARPDPRGFSAWSAEIGMYAATIKAAGHEATVLTTSLYKEKELRDAIHATDGKCVIIYTRSRQADQARAIGAFFALQYPEATVFFTGPHASAWPADCLNVAQGVYALRGFAEHLLGKLCDALETRGDFFGLPGLSFPVMNRFYHNPIGEPPELSERPLPDREVTAYFEGIEGLEDSIGAELELSRGEYNTSDRTQAAFDMSAPQTGVIAPYQHRTCAQVVSEANALRESNPELKFIGFRDEHGFADAAWAVELCEAWRDEVGMPFWLVSRPEYLKEAVFEALADAGCFRIFVTMESGADHVRRRVIGRHVSDSHLMYLARACRRFRIAMITVNEMGFPGETEDMIQQTVELNRRMRPDWSLVSVFHPEPGSAIYQRCESKQWLSKSSYGVFYDPDVIVEQPWIRPKKLDTYLRNFNEEVFGPAKVPARR